MEDHDDAQEAAAQALASRRTILLNSILLKGVGCPEWVELAQLNAAEDAAPPNGEPLQ